MSSAVAWTGLPGLFEADYFIIFLGIITVGGAARQPSYGLTVAQHARATLAVDGPAVVVMRPGVA